MKRNIRLYGLYISVILRSAMQYKLSFFLMALGRFLVAFNSFLAIHFLFSDLVRIREYTYGDILLCCAIVQMSFALAECVASGFSAFSGMVRRGDFDRILVRPCSPILQVLGSRFEIGRIGYIITAMITLVVGIQNSRISWNGLRILTVIFMLIGGMLLFSGLFLIEATICFFTVEDARFTNILTYGGKEHGKYPIDVYGPGLMKFCTYVIPFTLVQYYPLQYLLGYSQNLLYIIYPFGVIGFLTVCYGFWRFGMRRYQSTGS